MWYKFKFKPDYLLDGQLGKRVERIAMGSSPNYSPASSFSPQVQFTEGGSNFRTRDQRGWRCLSVFSLSVSLSLGFLGLDRVPGDDLGLRSNKGWQPAVGPAECPRPRLLF